jgi:hypothetical protein
MSSPRSIGSAIRRFSRIPVARKAWPTADLRVWPIDIVYSPLVPNPGDAVNVEFTVHNQGRQDARARIVFWLAAAEVDEERVEFVADVPAGRHYRFTRSIRLPMGSGTGFAGVQAQLAPPRGSLKRVEEAIQDNNDVARPWERCGRLSSATRSLRTRVRRALRAP